MLFVLTKTRASLVNSVLYERLMQHLREIVDDTANADLDGCEEMEAKQRVNYAIGADATDSTGARVRRESIFNNTGQMLLTYLVCDTYRERRVRNATVVLMSISNLRAPLGDSDLTLNVSHKRPAINAIDFSDRNSVSMSIVPRSSSSLDTQYHFQQVGIPQGDMCLTVYTIKRYMLLVGSHVNQRIRLVDKTSKSHVIEVAFFGHTFTVLIDRKQAKLMKKLSSVNPNKTLWYKCNVPMIIRELSIH